MRLILNIIWLIFGGLWLALGYLLAALICFVLIITIPFGFAALRIASYALWPFGRTIVDKPGPRPGALIGNVIWVILFGIWLAIGHVITAVAMAITIIGIPLALANLKLIPVSLVPLGKEIVPVDRRARHESVAGRRMTIIELGVPSVQRPVTGMPTDGPMVDTFGRVATDLRVSLTDRCNLRCTYCMPAEGLDWLPGEQLLRTDELTRLLRIAVTRLGITSVRFTGGEPLVAKHLEDVVAATASLTSPPRNHVDHQRHWAGQARRQAQAGRARPDQRLARHRRRRPLRAHHPPRPAARRTGRARGREGGRAEPGEGERRAGSGHRAGRRRRAAAVLPRPRIPAAHHRADAPGRRPRVEARPARSPPTTCWPPCGGISTYDPTGRRAVRRPPSCGEVDGGRGVAGKVGIIASVSHAFCAACDRTRLTADGQVRNCLFAQHETDLRRLMRAGADDDALEPRGGPPCGSRRRATASTTRTSCSRTGR